MNDSIILTIFNPIIIPYSKLNMLFYKAFIFQSLLIYFLLLLFRLTFTFNIIHDEMFLNKDNR